MTSTVPFNRLDIQGRELEYVRQAIEQGHVSGDGPFTKRCAALLERELGIKKALLTTSCTHALEMAAILLHVAPGDEVIVPSYTFVSTVNAFVLRGARPVFVDIRPDTLNLDENQIERAITEKTKAIIPVHYAGVGCEMDRIMALSRQYAIPVIEDNAHGLFGTYKGRPLGSFGCLSTLSFHETKNFACGEGGALMINDARYISRAEILRDKGTNRSRFLRGQVDKYTWVDIGSSYVLSDLLAAFLCGQLEQRQKIHVRRREIWSYYYNEIKEWSRENKVALPFVPDHCEQTYHMFYLLMLSLQERQALIGHLKARGILSVFHYVPLHLSDMGRRFGYKKGDFPVTEKVSSCLLRLPFYTALTEAEQLSIIKALREFKTQKHLLDSAPFK